MEQIPQTVTVGEKDTPWPHELEVLRKIAKRFPLLVTRVLKIKELYLYTQIYAPDIVILDLLKEEANLRSTSKNFENHLRRFIDDIYVQLVNERVISAIYHVISPIKDIDHNDKLCELYDRTHGYETLQDSLISAFERHSSFHRDRDVICPGNENDLYIAYLLPWEQSTLSKNESVNCSENYAHPFLAIENLQVNHLNEAEIAAITAVHGSAIIKFFSLAQKNHEPLYTYAMRICEHYRLAYPHESPMSSIACKKVFIQGLNFHYLTMFKRFNLYESMQNSSITFREVFGWLYLYSWLDYHKYPSSSKTKSHNPPRNDIKVVLSSEHSSVESFEVINDPDTELTHERKPCDSSNIFEIEIINGREVVDISKIPRLTTKIMREADEGDAITSCKNVPKRKQRENPRELL